MRLSMPNHHRMSLIAVDVAADLGIPLCDIMGPKKQRDITTARQLAMHEMHTAGVSKSEIARFFDRDHSTIIDGIRRVAVARKRKGAWA